MADNYTNVFGDKTVPPVGQTFRLIPLIGHLRLNWPDNYEGEDFLADINDVTGSAANWHMALPTADTTSTGRDFLIRNVGLFAFQVNNYNDVPVAVLQPGEVKYFYLTDNNSAAGIWNVFTFGTGTSAADASQLAGSGLKVVGSKLAAAHPVYSLAANVTATPDDRAKIFAFTGGSNTLTLPSVLELGDDWFCGVRNAGSGSITIAITGVDRIDDDTSRVLTPGESLFIFCTGATYYTVGYGRSTQFQFTKLVKDVSAGGSFTLTSGEASNKLLQFTGTPVSNVTIVVPAVVSIYYVQNAYSGSATLTVKTASGTGETLTTNNQKTILFCDGVNVVAASSVGGGGGGGGGTIPVGSIGDGTMEAPSIAFASDSDTGVYRVAEDTIGFATGGSERARWGVTSSSVTGNFGIGTITPQAKLDVRGLGIISGGGALSGTLPTGTQLQLGSADGSGTRMMIDAYGAPDGPMITLRQSRGTASAPTATIVGQKLGQMNFRGRGATTWSSDAAVISARASENWTDTAQGTRIVFSVTPNGTTVPVDKVVIDQSGWMSVGHSGVPLFALDVSGEARFTDDIQARTGYFTRDNPPIVLTNFTTQGGLVQCMYGPTQTVAGYWGARDGFPFIVWDKEGDDERFRVADSNAGVYAWAYNNMSDESLKEDWKDLPEDFLENLATVLSGEYRLKETKERFVGVSAQSLQRVLPQAVSEAWDGLLSVSYGNAALVACVALAREFLKLSAEVRSLKSLNNKE